MTINRAKILNPLQLFLASVFAQHLALGMIFPIVAAWQYQQGLSFESIGWVFALGLVASFIFEPLTSILADRFSKKIIIAVGILFLLGSSVFLSIGPGLLWYSLFTVVQSLGFAFLSGTEESYLHDIVSERGRAFTKILGKMQVFDEAGTIFGTILSTLLVLVFTPQVNFAIASCIFAVALAFVISIRTVSKNISLDAAGGLDASIVGAGLRRLVTDARFVISSMILTILFSILTYRAEIVFQKGLLEVGVVLSSFGVIYGIGKVFSILGSLAASKVENTFGSKTTITLMFIAQTLVIAILLFEGIWSMILSLCLFFFFENIFRAVFRSWMLNVVPVNHKTLFLSLYNMATTGVWALLNPLVGAALSINFVPAVALLLALRSVALMLFYILPSKKLLQSND